MFEPLRETAVTDLREGETREMYAALQHSKGGACVLLNVFTAERVHALLLQLLFACPERYPGGETLRRMEETLTALLSGADPQGLSDLFPGLPEVPYLSFRDVYTLLQSASAWDRLREAAARQPEARSEGPLLQPVTRERDSVAGKCLTLRLPRSIAEAGAEGEEAARTLRALRWELQRPRNRSENPKLTAALDEFRGLLGTQKEESGTCLRTLKAMLFCARQLYVEEGSGREAEVLRVVETLRQHIQFSRVSDGYAQTLRSLWNTQRRGDTGKFTSITISQMELRAENALQTLALSTDLVTASIAHLETPGTEDTQRIAALREQVERQARALAEGSGCGATGSAGSAGSAGLAGGQAWRRGLRMGLRLWKRLRKRLRMRLRMRRKRNIRWTTCSSISVRRRGTEAVYRI